MTTDCILREEDGLDCPGPDPERCRTCAYHYKEGVIVWLFGTITWIIISIAILLGIIITSPLWLIAGLIEKVNRVSA